MKLRSSPDDVENVLRLVLIAAWKARIHGVGADPAILKCRSISTAGPGAKGNRAGNLE
jgi:hypothetical protein